jgi:hypothetical protein
MNSCGVAAWVGLDWADQQHVICLYEVQSGQCEITRLEQKPEAFQSWLSQLRQRFGGAKVAVVLEQARGAVIYALLGYCQVEKIRADWGV